MAERTAATYELDGKQIRSDQAIIGALRDNLHSFDRELIEITVMRLSIRGKDCASFDDINRIFLKSKDDLIISACAFGLTALAACGGDYRSRAVSSLEKKLLGTNDPELRSIFQDQLEILNCGDSALN